MLTDPVYEGKSMAALIDLVRSGRSLPVQTCSMRTSAVNRRSTPTPERSEQSGGISLVLVSLMGQVLRVHAAVYERTDGRIGHRMLGVPTLMLRTTGRRSGATRTNSLVYARDGDDYLVVASNGGADRPPAWLHNVRAQPAVEVQVGRGRQPATARIVEPSDPSYERLWKLVNANNRDRYTAYQQQTTRPIPVIALSPR